MSFELFLLKFRKSESLFAAFCKLRLKAAFSAKRIFEKLCGLRHNCIARLNRKDLAAHTADKCFFEFSQYKHLTFPTKIGA